MKVFLITPPRGNLVSNWSKNPMACLGILYLAAVLEKNNIEVSVMDALKTGYDWPQFENELLKFKPDIIGVSFTTETRFEAFRAIRLIRKIFPSSLIVAGGAHVTWTAGDTLLNIHELDVVVRGEGEETFLELIKAYENNLSLAGILGLSYRQNGRVIHNSDRPFISNLDALPFPARHLSKGDKICSFLKLPNGKKIPALHIMTSRGCPIGCNFCITTQTWGRICRFRSPVNVVEEIEELIEKYKVKGLSFFDDTFTMNPIRAEQICDLIISRQLNISWWCEVRVDTVTLDLLKKMKAAGCYQVYFGVESGSQRVLDEIIKKKINLEQVKTVAKWCNEAGILILPTFIISHPTETLVEARQTINLMKELKSYAKGDITVGVLKIYPGTDLEKYAKKTGFLSPNFSWSKEDYTKVFLPSIGGNAPFFRDKLSWEEIMQLLFEWRQISGFSLLKRIPAVFRDIKSINDLKMLVIGTKLFLKNLLFKK